MQSGLVACCLTIACAWRLRSVPFVGSVALNVAALLQLWWPLWRADSSAQSLATLGLTWRNARRALSHALLWALITTPLWLACAWYFFTGTSLRVFHEHIVHNVFQELHSRGRTAVLVHTASAILTQVMGVALIEEVFWRGYVQPICSARWPRQRLLGLPDGAYVATLMFAATHLLEDAQPARLATFFPGVVFALLRSRNGTLAGCVALHAWDNLIAQLLNFAAR